MSSLVFNSLEYARRLEAAGFTRQQAETQANILAEVIVERVATKQDLRELELRLVVRFGAMLAAGVGLLSALIAFK